MHEGPYHLQGKGCYTPLSTLEPPLLAKQTGQGWVLRRDLPWPFWYSL